MEKVLLSAKQAAELSLEKGYEWFKNQVFKQIRETAEGGESELHWGISYPFWKGYIDDPCSIENETPFVKNICKIKSLLDDLGYSTRFIFHEDDETMDYVLVTELVIEWYSK